MAHPQLQTVRQRYNFQCGYCTVTETDVGGNLTVDHFQPLSADGTDDLDNLVYACMLCNQFKGAQLPTPNTSEQGERLLHPLRDDLSLHLRENEETGRLEGLTEAGRFQIEVLHLNRPELVANRQRRRFHEAQATALHERLLADAAIAEREDRRELYIAELERRIRFLEGQGEAE